MRPNRFTTACALSALLAACAGSQPATDAGNGGTPDAAAPASGSGTITGFGAELIVDGVPYDVTGATVTDDTDPANPATGTLDDLRIGQHVDVELASTCRLSHIAIHATVMGLVDPGSIDTAAHRFTVLGQTVTFSPAPIGTTDARRAGPATLFVGVQDAAGLGAGQLVKVHGAVDAQGVVAARLVVVLPEGTPLLQRVSGVVSGADAAARTFKIGALTVAHGGAKVLPRDAKIVDGEPVVVFSRKATTGTAPALTLPADTVHVRRDHFKVVTIRLGGPILAVTPVEGQAIPNLALQGVKVDSARATLEDGTTAGDLVVGAVVRVEGTLADGVLTAREIAVVPDHAQRKVVLAGQVSSFVSVRSFVVHGTTVDASQAAFAEGSSAAQLADGVRVLVVGHVSGAGVVADQVTVLPPPEKLAMTLVGVVDCDPDGASTTRTFRLHGTELRLDPDVVWTGGSASDLVDGALVRVTGTFEGRVFVATAVQFLGEPAIARPPLHLAGVISGVTADGFVLNNVTIGITSSTEIVNGPLRNGQRVLVIAEKGASGLVARSVQVHARHLDDGEIDPQPIGTSGHVDHPGVPVPELTGPVSAVMGATTIKVDAQLVDVSRATFLPAGRSAKDLAVGRIVTVSGAVAKGVLTAWVVTFRE